MGELRLTSIGVDDLRSLFSGSPQIEAHLTAVAASAFPPPEPAARTGLLGKIGPLTRTPLDAPVIKPGVPTRADIHDLVRGKFLKADRLTAAWTLVRLWLDASGWPTLTLQLTEAAMNELDFELATGGVPSSYALRRLLNDKLALPLRNAPGQVTGYIRFDEAVSLRESWRKAAPTLSPHNAYVAQQIGAWLAGLEGWRRFASDAHRPAPDLVASFTLP